MVTVMYHIYKLWLFIFPEWAVKITEVGNGA